MHRPYASLSPETARHTVTATSTSKAWNVPGLKAAQLILSDADDVEHWARVGFLYGARRLDAGRAGGDGRLRRRAATGWTTSSATWTATGGCSPTCSPSTCREVRYTPPEGTYLAWLDCRRLGLEGSAGAFFLDRAGVALVDGPECGRARARVTCG